MAMTTCKECGGSISTKAESCPHCGNQIQPSASSRFARAGCGCLMMIVGLAILVSLIAYLYTPQP